MTKDNWLTIALIISNFIALLIGPVLAARVTLRANQPTPIPRESQPKNLIQRIGGWFSRTFRSPWIIPPLSIIANAYSLLSDFRSSEPLTRRAVFFMAMEMAVVFFSLLNMTVLLMWGVILAQHNLFRNIVDVLTKFSNILERLQTTRDQANGQEKSQNDS